MKNLKFSRLFAAVMFVAVLGLTGCKPEPETVEPKAIEGTWLDASYGKSYYKITASTFENYGEDLTGKAYDSYAGDNVTIVETSETSGIIYMKYTKALCYTHSDFDNGVYTYDADAADVGKWYAISYKELTDTSVQLSGAVGAKSSCETLDEAKEEFTAEKGYFSYYSSCAKH